jgi:oxygen-independent coproporphyrinogen-3 oxidase
VAGLYIHIPFCKSRCTYCDFFSTTDETRVNAFVEALRLEAELRKSEVDEPVKTVYFGGGTPSRLQAKHLDTLFETLYRCYPIESTAEVTVEANPDDLTEGYLSLLTQQPVNRLSLGVQSFNDKELRLLSRRHTAQEATDAVKHAQEQGFHNISIDLIYGLPRQTEAVWQENLNRATELQVPHLSAYHLIYEEKTPIYALLQAGKVTPVDEETSNAMFAMLIDWMTQHNFIHYELSAFGKEGFFSRHNSAYWKGEKYLGLGPSAHSFDGSSRSWNVASITEYIHGVTSGEPYQEMERLSRTERYNEFILTGLRTTWGVNLPELRYRFGEELYRYCLENARKHIDRNLLVTEKEALKLTRDGLFISDGIMSDLMWVGKSTINNKIQAYENS